MLIRRNSNNNTPSASKTLARNGVPSIKLKNYRISPGEICKILPWHKLGKNTSITSTSTYIQKIASEAKMCNFHKIAQHEILNLQGSQTRDIAIRFFLP